jgi:hypothetical protein
MPARRRVLRYGSAPPQHADRPLGPALPGLLADMAHDQALARIMREEVLTGRRASIRRAISRGIVREEIRTGTPTDVLIDLLTAPCYFRLLFGYARITRAFIEAVVDQTLRGAGFDLDKSKDERARQCPCSRPSTRAYG